MLRIILHVFILLVDDILREIVHDDYIKFMNVQMIAALMFVRNAFSVNISSRLRQVFPIETKTRRCLVKIYALITP